MRTRAAWVGLGLAACVAACHDGSDARTDVRFPASALGAESEVLARQVDRFETLHPGIRVEATPTPDAADARRQLYVQWLNARAPDPDVLQLDGVWAAEFAAAGWVLALDRFEPDLDDWLEAPLAANRWRGALYALPWFVDVGMLYWRTDLLDRAPASYDELVQRAREARAAGRVDFGLVLQAARYEGLVTVFLEYLTSFGGEVLAPDGRVVVDAPAGVAALTAMREAIGRDGFVPERALAWHEEETRFAFQRGSALFMRNWPYAHALMERAPGSAVTGRFAVGVWPRTPAGRPAATLGGAQLAINARSDVPEAAWQLVEFLTAHPQMVERVEATGQLPPRRSLYGEARVADSLPMDARTALELVEAAVVRPVTPVYAELSEILQIALHRTLTGQAEPAPALAGAAEEIRTLFVRTGLGGGTDRREEGAAR